MRTLAQNLIFQNVCQRFSQNYIETKTVYIQLAAHFFAIYEKQTQCKANFIRHRVKVAIVLKKSFKNRSK